MILLVARFVGVLLNVVVFILNANAVAWVA